MQDTITRTRLSLLVVDDNASILELISRLLRGTEFSVTTACGGQEALSVFDSREFEIVLTDVVMPGMDGNQLADRIRAIKPGLPLVFMTGYADRLGPCDLFLRKPFTREALVEILRRALARTRKQPARVHDPGTAAAAAAG